MDPIYDHLKTFGAVKTNVPMSKHTTFRIGGPARFLVSVSDTEKLIALLNFLTGEGVDYFALGGGSNILWKDDEYDGVVIKMDNRNLKIDGNKISADAGVSLALVVNTATQNGLSGLEWGAGIPGTIGGAVRGNAGAYGGDTGQSISAVEVWRSGEVVSLNRGDCGFNYRESNLKNNGDIVLRAHFMLTPGDQAEIVKKTQGYIIERASKFARDPSAGSFFKNILLDQFPGDKNILPEKSLKVGKVGAAFLIENAGLKGYSVGGAKVSDQHANFIVNFNNATQADVLAVVEKVQKEVYDKYGVELDPEVEIVR
ncbi:MAG: UDP-N-acetylmuramate dehydrogenase [Candidatus Magasanikbacteria bacterium]|jgi:UDP-N-acetylmuramate dehydrogenase